jgi:hypothetical protein
MLCSSFFIFLSLITRCHRRYNELPLLILSPLPRLLKVVSTGLVSSRIRGSNIDQQLALQVVLVLTSIAF